MEAVGVFIVVSVILVRQLGLFMHRKWKNEHMRSRFVIGILLRMITVKVPDVSKSVLWKVSCGEENSVVLNPSDTVQQMIRLREIVLVLNSCLHT